MKLPLKNNFLTSLLSSLQLSSACVKQLCLYSHCHPTSQKHCKSIQNKNTLVYKIKIWVVKRSRLAEQMDQNKNNKYVNNCHVKVMRLFWNQYSREHIISTHNLPTCLSWFIWKYKKKYIILSVYIHCIHAMNNSLGLNQTQRFRTRIKHTKWSQ